MHIEPSAQSFAAHYAAGEPLQSFGATCPAG